MLTSGRWPIHMHSRASLPRTTKGKLAHCYANHRRQKIPLKDIEVQLAVKVGQWPWRLQQWSPGTHAQAPSKKGAQSGCLHRPHQLVDDRLPSPKKAEAALQVMAPSKQGMYLFQDCLSWRNVHSTKTSQKVLLWARNGTARNDSQK